MNEAARLRSIYSDRRWWDHFNLWDRRYKVYEKNYQNSVKYDALLKDDKYKDLLKAARVLRGRLNEVAQTMTTGTVAERKAASAQYDTIQKTYQDALKAVKTFGGAPAAQSACSLYTHQMNRYEVLMNNAKNWKDKSLANDREIWEKRYNTYKGIFRRFSGHFKRCTEGVDPLASRRAFHQKQNELLDLIISLKAMVDQDLKEVNEATTAEIKAAAYAKYRDHQDKYNNATATYDELLKSRNRPAYTKFDENIWQALHRNLLIYRRLMNHHSRYRWNWDHRELYHKYRRYFYSTLTRINQMRRYIQALDVYVRAPRLPVIHRPLAAREPDQCKTRGITNVEPFKDTSSGTFAVRGSSEWVIAEGPNLANIPKFIVQGLQARWSNCGTDSPRTTVFKDIAIRCGTFRVLLASSPFVNGCWGSKNLNWTTPVMDPCIFVQGKNKGSGRVYDSGDYLKDKDFFEGNEIQFDDGSNFGRLKIVKSPCAKQDCTPSLDDDLLEVQIQCSSATVTVTNEYSKALLGANNMDVTIDIPAANANAGIRVGTSGNMLNGLCGGWTPSTSDSWRKYVQNCRRNYFYTSICRDPFSTTPETSMFAAFEAATGGNYQRKYSRDTPVADEREEIDPQRMDLSLRKCLKYANDVVPRAQYRADTSDPLEVYLYPLIGNCQQDEYHDLSWATKMQVEICDFIDTNIQQERRDMYCSAKTARALSLESSVDNILEALKRAKSPNSVDALYSVVRGFVDTVQEIDDSAREMGYWNVPTCPAPLPFNFSTMDCSAHSYLKSLTDLSQSVSAQKMTILGVANQVSQEGIVIPLPGQLMTSPVIFLGAPEFRSPTSVVARTNRTSNGFRVFVAEPFCLDYVHAPESVPYVILDTKFNYGSDVVVMVVENVNAEWRLVEFPQDLGPNVKLFATIQSANNKACTNCDRATQQRPNGFVTVAIKALSGTSVKIKIVPDKRSFAAGTALDNETIAILAVRNDTGSLAGVPFQATNTITKDSRASYDYEERPGTTQTYSFQPFSHPPVVLAQLTSFSDKVPANLRGTALTPNRWSFMVDEDNCPVARNEKLRSHGPESISLMALDQDV
eukprot:c32203_g1_i1.p1 GENE.c32203_g1_i1~~c32203_g1_i1.p1  ORF type:complete len:1177 (-),score=208.56 c32203_g1_i1:40-3288(-)